ncbi:unnamed protein product [Lactuca saligna]|uniref:Uncharacterized protein n=1 Tax=Lactuca saligna TaxID=75948 RepID=A0AA35Z6P6_LACSI|nr:unnamed protein product [Lactuca saligna]
MDPRTDIYEPSYGTIFGCHNVNINLNYMLKSMFIASEFRPFKQGRYQEDNHKFGGFQQGVLKQAMEPSILGSAFTEGGPDRKIKLDCNPGIDEDICKLCWIHCISTNISESESLMSRLDIKIEVVGATTNPSFDWGSVVAAMKIQLGLRLRFRSISLTVNQKSLTVVAMKIHCKNPRCCEDPQQTLL